MVRQELVITEHCEWKRGKKYSIVFWFVVINLLSSQIYHKLRTMTGLPGARSEISGPNF